MELNDPTVLRAIAHPVRNRILTELGARGSMRAADIAASLDIPANQASFHLRQLAKYGLVVEDPEAARDRRDRVWKQADVDQTVSLRRVEEQPGGKAASAVFRRTKAAWSHQVVELAYGDDRTPGRYVGVSEKPVRVSRAEAEELAEELLAVTDRWAERGRAGTVEPDDGPDADADADRRTYLVFLVVMPFPDAPGAP